MVSIEELLKAINEKVHCVCFFGGDPGPQLPFIIEFSKRARKIKKDLRICLETNGIENKKMLEEIAKISFESNGIIKFDLKFFDEKLSIAISGVSNKRAFENFENLAKIDSKKLVASTLLIPGYVDEEQVFKIAKFISSIDPQIPYNLLAFYPCFKFSDLPTTSFDQAQACFESAKKAGLKNVRIGNVHLLS
jgi:pyruvate formate lyase activating enzyme